MNPFNFTAPSCEYHDGECDCPEAAPEEVDEGETTPVPFESMRDVVEGGVR